MSSYGREADASPSAGYSNDNWIKLAVPVSIVLLRLERYQRELGGLAPAGFIAQPEGQREQSEIRGGCSDLQNFQFIRHMYEATEHPVSGRRLDGKIALEGAPDDLG